MLPKRVMVLKRADKWICEVKTGSRSYKKRVVARDEKWGYKDENGRQRQKLGGRSRTWAMEAGNG